MRKNGMPEVLFRSVMSLCEGAKKRVSVDSQLSQWGCTTDLCCNIFAFVLDVVTELTRGA